MFNNVQQDPVVFFTHGGYEYAAATDPSRGLPAIPPRRVRQTGTHVPWCGRGAPATGQSGHTINIPAAIKWGRRSHVVIMKT
jgi:hypothetical protein